MVLGDLLNKCYQDYCYFSLNTFDIENQIEDLTHNDQKKLRSMLNQIAVFIDQKRFDVILEFIAEHNLNPSRLEELKNDKSIKFDYIKQYYYEWKLDKSEQRDHYDRVKDEDYKVEPDMATYFLQQSFSDKSFYALDELLEFVLKKINENQVKDSKYKQKKTLDDFIFNVDNKNLFIESLKNSFVGEKGINIKLMIVQLQKKNIFIIQSREFKSFVDCLRKEFPWDIGTYSALNDLYKGTTNYGSFYDDDIKMVCSKLAPLIIKHKIK